MESINQRKNILVPQTMGTNRWSVFFITSEGRLIDFCSRWMDHFWYPVTFLTANGNIYMVGGNHRQFHELHYPGMAVMHRSTSTGTANLTAF